MSSNACLPLSDRIGVQLGGGGGGEMCDGTGDSQREAAPSILLLVRPASSARSVLVKSGATGRTRTGSSSATRRFQATTPLTCCRREFRNAACARGLAGFARQTQAVQICMQSAWREPGQRKPPNHRSI